MKTLKTTLHTITEQFNKGNKAYLPKPAGSADAYVFANLARELKKPLIIFCAEPTDAQRLLDEIILFDADIKIGLFPDWETLPYDTFSPHQDLISERLKTLHALSQNQLNILTVPVTTALYHLAPSSFLAARTFFFKQGDTLNESALRTQLALANYEHVSQVTAPGEFCIRGSIIDLYPMGSALPYRLDLFDDEIESIRSFDIDTQRSLYPVKEIQLLPGREFPMDEESRQAFRTRFREKIEGDPSKVALYKDMGNGIAAAGIEYYLPLFFDKVSTLFDYLPTDSNCLLYGDLQQSIERFSQETEQRYQFLKSDAERPVLPPSELFLTLEKFYSHLKNFAQIKIEVNGSSPITTVPDVSVAARTAEPFAKLQALLEQPKQRVLLCADSAGRHETLSELLQTQSLHPIEVANISEFFQGQASFAITTAPIYTGFQIPDEQIVILGENDLYPSTSGLVQRRRKRQESASNIDTMIRDLAELREGDPVVHVQYGIGRYQGLIHMDMGDGQVEMLHIQYANDSSLYVPVSQLHVISRYSGADHDHAPLHQLGSGQWDKARKKAARQARDTAAELLHLYAQRALRQGTQFKLPLSDYHAFSEGFGFEETADQANAIAAVIDDMTSGKPMDRLVCGDVGFGKTEVALRAAFICAANGRQVALLCPTTLLAEQHAQTFANRFAQWPITVTELSRFRTSKEINTALEGLAKGTVDIVIGTHKLLSKDVRFKNLGLVIIDEEHRFGVRQKEALKALRAEVDVLTLTATPIPRTLGMSLDGIRDFSVIATAPQKRLAIKTFVRREDGSTIREAILRELKRGGQVYFLHNEVETIENRKARLEELVPEAKIVIAHGQMPERELEQVMKGFYQQRFNVLLCTTIIETGIDVPTANTIIIQRADRFGLAQLHQLRGRVGRSHHQAYAYLLTHGEDAMTRSAKKRLEAIQSMEELGSGFYLAMHDLEIRGTGEVLGDAQSGNIQEVGYSLYADMLGKAIRALREGKEPNLDNPFTLGCEVQLHVSAMLPEDYCPDIHARLSIYKRLAHAHSDDDIYSIQEELIDRFGKIPSAARALLDTHRLRLLAESLGITKLDLGDTHANLIFTAQTSVDPKKLIQLIQTNRQVKLQGSDKLRLLFKEGLELKARIDQTFQLLRNLK